MADVEKSFMGESRSKMWTYIIFLFALLIIAVLINVVFSSPAAAKHALENFIGLPGWLLTVITAAIGALIFWLGLKVEADWPEAVGAFLIAAAVVSMELMVGWARFELGLVILPYLLPVAVFIVLLAIGMKRSA
jgi:uncharacterized membrane protein YhaH (DUF805 family)